jgi:hypothetical protein
MKKGEIGRREKKEEGTIEKGEERRETRYDILLQLRVYEK